MDAWIDFAGGPLFRISLTVFILGLGYRLVVVLVQIGSAWRRAGDRRLPFGEIVGRTLGWLVPYRLLNRRALFSVTSVVFHVGIILVPLFLLGHVVLLGPVLPSGWPVLPPAAADVLTVVTFLALGGLVLGRLSVRTGRDISRPQDLTILIILMALVGSGFLAANPGLSPVGARWMVLAHILLGDLALVLTPTTKIAHCVLFPFSQLIAMLAWRYPASSGRGVAVALGKEHEAV